MAIDYPLLTRKRLFACKAEGNTGTAETLTNAEAAYVAYDTKAIPQFANTDRPAPGTASKLPSVPGAAGGRLTLRTELCGSGAASAPSPAWANTLLKAASFASGGNIYNPVTGSATYTSLTAAEYIDGIKKFLAGAVANFTLTGEPGKPAIFSWDLLGVWQDPVAASLLAPTYPTVIPPRCASQTFTIGAVSYRIGTWELAMNNELYLREDGRTSSAYFAAAVVDRAITFRCTLEAQPLGSKNWYADHKAATEAAISLQIGSTAGNTITIAIPKGQLMTSPEDEDAGKTLKHPLVFQANQASAPGDNELTITFS